MNGQRGQVFWKCKYIVHLNEQRDLVVRNLSISSYELTAGSGVPEVQVSLAYERTEGSGNPEYRYILMNGQWDHVYRNVSISNI